MNSLTKSAANFKRTISEHAMTIHHDEGIYRHVEFSNYRSSIHRFELVTWPGHLSISGDMDGFVFARIHDMFKFFRRQEIDPNYWSEKITTDRASAMAYSEDLFSAQVSDELRNARNDYPGIARAWREHLDGYSPEYENEARDALDSFEYQVSDESGHSFRFSDTWEWQLKDYTSQFLWSCHAIAWGISQYDAVKSAAKKAVAA